jgi:protein export-related membrane protein
MTGGLTFLTVLSLLILGGDVLRGFAFVMTIGIIVGTYSSIYVASPFALLWENLFGVNGKWRKGKPGAMSRGGAPEPGRRETRTTAAPAEGDDQVPAAPARPRRSRQARRRA